MAATPSGGPGFEYAAAQPERDLPALSRLISLAFGSPVESVKEWLTNAGLHEVRLLREGADDVACGLRVPMGQFFGGRGVPMLGIAGVAVAPEARGRGMGTRVMQGLLKEARAEGVPICTLYPATLPLYRRVGFEQSGYWLEYRLPIARIDVAHSALRIRPMNDDDMQAVKDCYRHVAVGLDGYLDRGDYIWNRITHPRQGAATGFVIDSPDGAGLAGYVFIRQEKLPSQRHDVYLTDICASTPTAAVRLLNFLSEFGSVGEEVVFYGGPLHPLTPLLSEQKFKMNFKEYWMVRILNVAKALEARGYLPGAHGEVHFDVGDELFPENSGRYVLHVNDGHGTVKRGGSGSVRLNIRALASLYTGFASPQSLRLLGRIEGDEVSLRGAAALFAGAPPSMPDMF
jgi:predicted acetyltransferase